jgi:hypothetical protein
VTAQQLEQMNDELKKDNLRYVSSATLVYVKPDANAFLQISRVHQCYLWTQVSQGYHLILHSKHIPPYDYLAKPRQIGKESTNSLLNGRRRKNFTYQLLIGCSLFFSLRARYFVTCPQLAYDTPLYPLCLCFLPQA